MFAVVSGIVYFLLHVPILINNKNLAFLSRPFVRKERGGGGWRGVRETCALKFCGTETKTSKKI